MDDALFVPEPGQQTFSDRHWDQVGSALCNMDSPPLAALYRGSYSATFGADFRALVRQVIREDVIAAWESAA